MLKDQSIRGKLRSLWDMEVSEEGIISEISDNPIVPALIEMGCLPGLPVRIIRKAIFGGPVYVKINSNLIALRKEEAKLVQIK